MCTIAFNGKNKPPFSPGLLRQVLFATPKGGVKFIKRYHWGNNKTSEAKAFQRLREAYTQCYECRLPMSRKRKSIKRECLRDFKIRENLNRCEA